jgi:hypothetical protein
MELIMKPMQMVAGALMLGTAALATSASAGVSFGIGIGIPGPTYYSVRTGPCADPNFAYYHPYRCGYPTYAEPVYIDGAWVHDQPLYYRTYAGSRYFWWHGGWHVGHGHWDGRDFDGDRDRDRDRY